MTAQLPAWAAIWRSISRAFTSPQEQQAEAEEKRELVERALIYEELVKHPGWALYQEELRALIASTEEALISRLPFPESGAPTPEWQLLQDIALRGQRQGYVVARELVANVIAAAEDLVKATKRGAVGENDGDEAETDSASRSVAQVP